VRGCEGEARSSELWLENETTNRDERKREREKGREERENDQICQHDLGLWRIEYPERENNISIYIYKGRSYYLTNSRPLKNYLD